MKPTILAIANDDRTADVVMAKLGLRQREWAHLRYKGQLMGLSRAVIVFCGPPPATDAGYDLLSEIKRLDEFNRVTVMRVPG